MSRATAIALPLLLAAISCDQTRPRHGGDTVGNGGDAIRFLISEGRREAALRTAQLNPASLTAVRAEVKDWVTTYRAALVDDILQSPHQIAEKERTTCAWTERRRNGAIQFSYSHCTRSLSTASRAGMLLIHESVHHFGIDDESFADDVALAIYAATKSPREAALASLMGLYRGRIEKTAPEANLPESSELRLSARPETASSAGIGGTFRLYFGGYDSNEYQEMTLARTAYFENESRVLLEASELGLTLDLVFSSSTLRGTLSFGGRRSGTIRLSRVEQRDDPTL